MQINTHICCRFNVCTSSTEPDVLERAWLLGMLVVSGWVHHISLVAGVFHFERVGFIKACQRL